MQSNTVSHNYSTIRKPSDVTVFLIFSKFNFRLILGVYPRKPRNIGFAGVFCILASAVFLKTGISVSGKPQNCPHSGSQGRTQSFCLRCQLLLHTVTLSGDRGQIKLLPVVLLHGLFQRQDGMEQRTVPMLKLVFGIPDLAALFSLSCRWSQPSRHPRTYLWYPLAKVPFYGIILSADQWKREDMPVKLSHDASALPQKVTMKGSAARWLAGQEMMPQALLRLDGVPAAEELAALAEYGCGVLTGSGAVVTACAGLDPRAVFLSAAASEDELRAAHGRCRYLAEMPEELQKLDALVGPLLPEGYLEDIAIRVWPEGGGAFTAENIPVFARLIRRTDNLAVRALFLPFDQSGDLSRQAKDTFSLVKKIRSDLPCMLHAFCFEGLLEPLAQGDTELRQTLKMLASLNDTSLYASFFIS